MSFLDKLPQIKQRVADIATDAKNEGWTDADTLSLVMTNLQAEKITIGIVGQIKYGKSTLLNALIFGDNILPSASTPMTASLTHIKYGDKNVGIEFYTSNDWREIEDMASDKTSSIENDAARQLVEGSMAIKKEMNSLIGTSKTIKYDDIMSYVGDGGKYVPVTKALTIAFPATRLKDADFIDTPGFNDPIVSREIRASDSLKKADVIIVLLYAQRPFDKTDKEIFFRKLKMAGAGKVVVILNKYDLLLDDQGTEDKVMKHISDIWKKEVEVLEKDNPTIAGIFKTAQHIPCSSLMALLGKMDINKIAKDEDLQYHYSKFKSNYPMLRTPEDFVNMSKLPEIEAEIDNIIKNQKIKILVQKPITSIVGSVRKYRDSIDNEIFRIDVELKNLQKSTPEIAEERKNFGNIKKDSKDKIKSAITELNEEVKTIKREILTSIKKAKNEMLLELSDRIPEKRFTESVEDYLSKCRVVTEDLLLSFKSKIEGINDDCMIKLHLKLKYVAMSLDAEIDAVVSKHMTYESNINDVKTKFQEVIEAQNIDLSFSAPELQNEYTDIISDIINAFIPFWENIVGIGNVKFSV